MMRNSKTPILVILCLLGVIGLITYNYWSATQRHLRIKEALIMSEEKINELIEKKSYADKQIGLSSDRVEKLKKELEEAQQASEQKDKDVADMNARMKKKEQERDKFALENSELKETLRKAQTDSILAQQDLAAKTIEFTNQIERYKQELETAKKEATNCGALVDAKMQEFRNSVSYLARAQFNKFESEKIQDILSNAAKSNMIQNSLSPSQGGKLEFGANAQAKDQQLQQPQQLQPQQLQPQQLQQQQVGNNLNNHLLNNNNNNNLNNVNVVQIQPQLSKTMSPNDQMRGKRETEQNLNITNTNNNNGTELVGVERDEEVTTKDVCQLPKATGTCEKSIERYFFDSMSQRCLLFVFTGCEGNENNFETVEACQAMCLDVARVDKPTQ